MIISGFVAAGGAIGYLGVKIYHHQRSKKRLGDILSLSDSIDSTQAVSTPASLSTKEVADEFTVANQKANHYLVISGTGMILAVAGALFYSPLGLVSVPILLYAALPIFQEAYTTLVYERRLRAPVLDSVAIVGGLVAQYYVVMAFASCLYFVGFKLLLKTEDNSLKSLVNIFGQQPRFVWRIVDGVEVQAPFAEIKSGDVIVVNTGEMIPADGLIVDGLASVDQHQLTGESQPAEKGPGESVFAATVILSGHLLIEVERAGTETVAAQIGEILNHTTDYKSTLEARGRQLADQSVLPTLGLSVLALLTRGLVGGVAVASANFSDVLRVVSPLGMLNILTIATKKGILIKDGRSLELLSQVDTVIFDKTGTLTLEQPHVGQIHVCGSLTQETLLTYAAAAEHRQSHPIAKAIQQAVRERQLVLPAIDEASYEVGYGLKVRIEHRLVRVGSARFMALEQIDMPEALQKIQTTTHDQGYSLVYVAVDDRLEGAIELQPTLRPEAPQIIQQLKDRGLSLYIISGDHDQPTRNLAARLGIDHYFAEVLPEDKANLVEQLQQEGRVVCFVGDGINDSIALKKAQVSVSIRGASTIATDTAQIVLMSQSLSQLDTLFQLAHDLDANLKSNVFLTFGPGVFCAGGVFFLHFGILSAVVLYNVTLIAGVANAMLPWLNHQRLLPAPDDSG